MSKRKHKSAAGTMLELWRPPSGAGDPVGCLATTFTFDPGLFDEACLARFLEIESEPDREDLAFLLERETRLGGVYAGVLVDHTQAGVEHSLRWDVLPVRLPSGKQHAKLSLLAWTNHVRIVVASANLTEAGYRYNHEVAAAIDLTPTAAPVHHLESAMGFLRDLLAFVPAGGAPTPELGRAREFLQRVDGLVRPWKVTREPRRLSRQLVFTLPGKSAGPDGPVAARSSLDEAITLCRRHGSSPHEAWVASPFFDVDDKNDAATAALCQAMARGGERTLWFCVPAAGAYEPASPRLAAPASLRTTPQDYRTEVGFEVLPEQDADRNARPWHAKMIALMSNRYSALLIGSSNFTRAGLGIGTHRNAEANLLTIAERARHAREPKALEAVWPEMPEVADPASAEWLGPQVDRDEETLAQKPPVPAGFLAAVYRAGDDRTIVLQLDPERLPETWLVAGAAMNRTVDVLDHERWQAQGRPAEVSVRWGPIEPPAKLLVRWPAGEAWLPLNVEDSRTLPPPAELQRMSADEMLRILAASDPGAAFCAWAKGQGQTSLEDDLDTAPVDLDPLRRYDLHVTFLHPIRHRARILVQLRQNLEHPAWSTQAIEWRLRGLIGIEPLAQRMVAELAAANGQLDEALLALADFLIVLKEVDYKSEPGAVPKETFERMYRSFLSELAADLDEQVSRDADGAAPNLQAFWRRVVERCRA